MQYHKEKVENACIWNKNKNYEDIAFAIINIS